MTRAFGFITDLPAAALWVMDSKVQYVEDIKPLSSTQVARVRGVNGVLWAVPLYKGLLRARLNNGIFQSCTIVGIDDETLIGAPPKMLVGSVADLRRADGVIVDEVGARGKLAREVNGVKVPLVVGDTLEINYHRAIVVGIARVSRTFGSQPVIYTTYSRATSFAPPERKLLSFVLVKNKPDTQPEVLSERIMNTTGLKSIPRKDFIWMTIQYYLKNTGIPINFGIAVILGFLVGTAIAGQTFFSFAVENLRAFAALKAMGAKSFTLFFMIVVQSVIVGFTGYGLGVGLASMFFYLSKKSELAFFLPWQLLALVAGAVTIICLIAATLSVIKVIRVDPAIVFRG
jgi:putative ABC transport system permease protein